MNVWHYTPRIPHIKQIIEAGELRPSNTAGLYAVPLLWFSANQEWEPMAAALGPKRVGSDAMRFGIDVTDHRLMDWLKTCAVAKRNRYDRRCHEKAASKLGSDPTLWYATTESIAIDGLVDFQIWRDGKWMSA